MRSGEIRQRFLDHFAARGHTVVPSASLLLDDPTLLFVNAGMVPFKPYFLGEVPPPYPRATSVQKVVRTPDIDVVGTTTRHLTFFQMAGNFSFGDYFKAGAIPYAWELLTNPVDRGGYGFDPQRLWVTVYLDDDEAADIWHRDVGVPVERIQRRDMEDNFWSMGVPGPCGPCSEIYYDRGPAYGRQGGPVVDEDRYLEVWNLVFMQYERGGGPAKRDYEILGELPKKNIDTGLGVERMAVLLQDVDNVYETDMLRAVLDTAGDLAGVRYGDDPVADVRLRVVADHTRTSTMLVADGVTPGNEGRGYVLRRLLRRTVRMMRLLGYPEPAMPTLVARVRDEMGESYPELVRDFGRIEAVVQAEEEAFRATLHNGTRIFDVAAAELRASGGATLPGERVFQLHDTYGFPVDLTLEMAAEAGLTVDEAGFRRLMAEQRTRAKADARAKKTGHVDVAAYRALLDAAGGVPEFVGYTQTWAEASVRGLLVGDRVVPEAAEGTEVELVLDRTPFYAEAGGQLADEGVIRLSDGLLRVVDVQKPVADLVVHRAVVASGVVRLGDLVQAEVDVARRAAISRAHTATHLVHQGMRRALGEQAAQAGSLNAPGRLRFDFGSPAAVPPSVLRDVEQEINEVLLDDLEVTWRIMSQDDARRIGAMALFGEKYGDRVRVVEVGDYARELCGGTHVARSGQIGIIKLLGEASIGSGVRRVEGLVGLSAVDWFAREHALVGQLTDLFRVPEDQLAERIVGTVERLREADKEIERLRARILLARAAEVAAGAHDVGGVAVVGFRAPDGTSADDVRRLAVDVRGRLADRPAAVAVAAAGDGKVSLVVAVNDPARARGLSAGDLVRVGAAVLGGRGGGKPDLAQGGGTDVARVGEAFAAVRAAVAG